MTIVKQFCFLISVFLWVLLFSSVTGQVSENLKRRANAVRTGFNIDKALLEKNMHGENLIYLGNQFKTRFTSEFVNPAFAAAGGYDFNLHEQGRILQTFTYNNTDDNVESKLAENQRKEVEKENDSPSIRISTFLELN